MPSLPPAALAMPQLYTHTFDIDDVIGALCATPPAGQVWVLDTLVGKVMACAAGAVPESKHHFVLTPLPASYVAQLRSHDQRDALDPVALAELDDVLASAVDCADLAKHFEHGKAGGWLRERVKEAALDWLDGHNLIPPSMRHVKKLSPAYMPNPVAKKVTFN